MYSEKGTRKQPSFQASKKKHSSLQNIIIATCIAMRKPQQPHEVLEQELENLTSRGQDYVEEEVRKRMRVIKNRLSAKKSREQARDYVQKLEGSISALTAQNQSLARRLAMVEYENATLRHQMYFAQPSTTPPQNHVDQPAALSKSPQLDAVLALVWATLVMLIGLALPRPETLSTGSLSREPRSPWMRMFLTCPLTASWHSPGQRRLSLRRLGLLGWREHLFRSTNPALTPGRALLPNLAAAAA